MKVDEACINHNALRLIQREVAQFPKFINQDEECESIRLAALGEIRGVCVLAEALKEVLNE
jgi:hypothetical protein